MSTISENSTAGNYYSGGLAELVSSPTPLTYSFLVDWFTGIGSLGKAMKLLGMPYQEVKLPLLIVKDHELLVNLTNEERTLYQKTIFTYKKQNDIHQAPQLVIDFVKSVHPSNLKNTLKILLVQSKWIAHPKIVIAKAKKFVGDIPSEASDASVQEVDELLKNDVWPNVTALGLMSEFYNQLLIKEAKENITDVNNYISNTIAKSDWFFGSVVDQIKVKQKTLSFSDYIEKYGLRADKDYELTSPRWYEMQDVIKKRIHNSTDKDEVQSITLKFDKKLQILIDTSVALQLLRSESKRKTLLHINQLRKAILQETTGLSDISHLTKEDLLRPPLLQQQQNKTDPEQTQGTKVLPHTSGIGISVSQGHAKGLVQHITNNDTAIPKGTIGVFSNASPEFATQYPKCAGMIFLRGGQTSHGAIVAREFRIPAIIDGKAGGLTDNTKVALNAVTGEWRTL